MDDETLEDEPDPWLPVSEIQDDLQARGAYEMNCVFCDQPIEGMGHNPEPLADFQDRCCGECNAVVVVPARLGILSPSIRRLIDRPLANR